VLTNNVADPLYNAGNKGFVYNIRGMGSYTIGNGWGLQLFGFYRGRQVQLQGYQGGFGIYSLSLRKEFNDKKASIGFGAENFFAPSINMRSEVVSPLIDQTSINTMRNRSFKVTFSYRIGKVTTSMPKRSKSVNNDDLKGGESNSGGQEGSSGTSMGSGVQPQAPKGGQGGKPAGEFPGTMPKGASVAAPKAIQGEPSSELNRPSAGSTQTGQAAASGLTGKWSGNLGMIEATMNLKAEGDTLSGTMSTPLGETHISGGKINGETFSFRVSLEGSEIVHEGKLAGNQLTISTVFGGNPIQGIFNREK
jgi:hypothetical protein